MRSKEDCLINQAGAYLLNTDQLFHPSLSTIGRNIGSIVVDRAMDEYAKEVAIAFSDWKRENEWIESKSRYGKWYCEKDGVRLEYFTHEELFNQFIQSIK